jgi:phage/plasmid-like protein (TIGR03299 family)
MEGDFKMAHMIEIRNEVPCIYLTGEPAWHGLGTPVMEAKTSDEVLKICQADWNVIQKPLFIEVNGQYIKLEDNVANMRDVDNKILGVVGNRYKILQNSEAFNFTDALIGEGATYESAGVLQGGKRIWILARLPETKILSDDIVPYIVFTTAHDGTGGVKVAMTPIRVVCQNTLTLALTGAKRIWTARHTETITGKIEEAQKTLGLASAYMETLNETAELLQEQKINKDMLEEFMETIFPLPEEEGLKYNNVLRMRNTFGTIYNDKMDLHKFGDSGWKVMGAMSDFITHVEPLRNTSKAQENKFMGIVDGSGLMENAERFLLTRVA